MDAATLIPVQEYLRTSFSLDREYRDGLLVERNLGTRSHAWLQGALIHYLSSRRKQWNIATFPELRIRVRQNWYSIPDVCVYLLSGPEQEVPSSPPLLWIEILSPDDRMVDVWNRANELVANGVPYVWIIDPITLESELRTAAGTTRIADKTLHVPGSSIVVPLTDVLE